MKVLVIKLGWLPGRGGRKLVFFFTKDGKWRRAYIDPAKIKEIKKVVARLPRWNEPDIIAFIVEYDSAHSYYDQAMPPEEYVNFIQQDGWCGTPCEPYQDVKVEPATFEEFERSMEPRMRVIPLPDGRYKIYHPEAGGKPLVRTPECAHSAIFYNMDCIFGVMD
jgi:hypothetical protein